jgi:HK97 family phage portal protein
MNWRGMGRRVANLLRRQRVVEQRIHVHPVQAGVVVTPDSALTFAAVWACVSVISRTIAALPWRVFVTSERGRDSVDSTVAWLLNNQPNSEMTAFSFREALMSHVLLWGNAYAEIERDLAGRPTALWIITPDRVTVKRDEKTGELGYDVRGEYDQVRLRPDQVLHIHGLGFDGVVGYSPVQMAARSMGIGIAQDAFGAAFYANGTVFGAVAEMPGAMNGPQMAATEAELNGSRKGPDNAFKFKVAPQGTKLHQLSMPMTDAQFLESRKFSVTEVARWYGVPPHKIADLDRSTNNNIEHQGIEFVTDAIVPWAVRLEQETNVKLFGARAQGRVYTKLMVNALMRGDAKSRSEFYRTMTQIGAMSINEVRELEELNTIGTAGDSHLVQLNQTTLEWLVENPDAKAAAPPSAPEPNQEGASGPSAFLEPTNVIRAEALEWYRQQRNN